MIRTYGKKLVFGVFGFILVLAAGCQSVGGVDVNQALINNFNIQSSEGNLSVTIDLVPKSTATQEQRALQDKIKAISLSFDEIKTQDPQHASYQGALTSARGKVPFAIHVNGHQTIVKIEGANKPIVFDLGLGQMAPKSAASDQGISSISQTLIPSVKGVLMDKSGDLGPLLTVFIASHMDNPKKITVTPVTETIHSESLNLNKLHTEISGVEAGEMIQKMFSSIGADEKGLQELLGSLYDAVAPELLKNKDGLNPLLVMVLENKDLAVNTMHQMVKEYISGASGKANAKMKEGKTFTDQMYVKTDMYLDNRLLAHKMTVEAMLPVPADNDRGIAAVKISATSDSWNLNKPVKAQAIAVGGDTLQAGGSGKLLNPSELLSIFDKQSVGYKMLREDMQITRKRLQMTMGQDAGQDPGQSGRPFIKNGYTLVPVRYVVEQLDAEVKWDDVKKQVTVKDALTGNEMIFTINSKTALLNGSPVKLDTEAIINSGGSTYVPVRFITEQGLGGKINWDESTRTVSIVRD